MKSWEKDKRWSDKFLPEIKRIVGEYLISEPPVEEDAERNTDLIVLRLDAVRIACRIRQHKYMQKYGDEFTIRAERPSGQKTELSKIMEGWGDYFFYGFASDNESCLSQWMLGDLKVFRIYLNRQLWLGKKNWCNKNNHDNSSSFIGFKIDEVPGFVVARKTKTPDAATPGANLWPWNESNQYQPVTATTVGW